MCKIKITFNYNLPKKRNEKLKRNCIKEAIHLINFMKNCYNKISATARYIKALKIAIGFSFCFRFVM